MALILHIIVISRPVQNLIRRLRGIPPREPSESPAPHVEPESLWASLKHHTERHGGSTIFAYMLTRLVGCLTLLGFSITSLVLDEVRKAETGELGIMGKWGKKHKGRKRKSDKLSVKEWMHVAMCMTFVRRLD